MYNFGKRQCLTGIGHYDVFVTVSQKVRLSDIVHLVVLLQRVTVVLTKVLVLVQGPAPILANKFYQAKSS